MTRTRFKDILQNLHFSNNANAGKSDKGYKFTQLITHFNESFTFFTLCVSNDVIQNVKLKDVKSKDRSSMKQYERINS